MTHIVLLGDSIFDNRSYTRGEPDVVTHLRGLLPDRVSATLVAVDGATTRSMKGQIARIPGDATHLVVSVGGNDALGHSDLLRPGAALSADPMANLAGRIEGYEADYRAALQPVLARRLPTTLCTIYNGALPDAGEARRARIGLMLFNDVITRAAAEHHASLIELRLVCSEPEDYANPIEPSGRGGLKIAQAIACATGVLPYAAGKLVGR